MPEKTLLDDPNFCEFYVTAKKSAYAAGGDQKAEILRNGGKRYVFYDGERWPQWRYTDIYHRYNPFSGIETVDEFDFTSPLPSVWMPVAQMFYGGYAQGTQDEVKQMFAFLEKLLGRVTIHSLFRGPIEHIREDGFQYYCQWKRISPFCVEGKESIIDYTLHMMEEPAYYQLGFQFNCLR